jgi:acylphosphatase
MLKALQVRVYGRVQRVGYRRFVLDSAQELGLSGYVKNEKDGSVTVFAQGDEAILEKFVEMLKSPPPPAHVKSIDVKEAKPRPAIKYFTIRPSPLHEELQEGFGAMQSIFMDYWKEFRDYRDEFRDYRNEFRSFVGEFRDYRNEFRSFVGEFRDYRNEFREFARRTDENFKAIMEKYGEISEKLTIILETLTRESKETREMLNETMKLLKEALERLPR